MPQLSGTDSASESLLKPLKPLHRRAVKIILLKNTSLTNDDYKKTTILPLKHRLMYNKARFMHKILSGKAPTYLVKKSVYQPLFQKLLVMERTRVIGSTAETARKRPERPWTVARTMEAVKAVSPRHCPATCALRNCSFNCCAGQSH